MANLYVTVYAGAAEVASGRPSQQFVGILIGATSTPSTETITLPAGNIRRSYRIRVLAESNCFVTWGPAEDSPVAKNDGTDGRAVGAENPEYFEAFQGDKIAVIERI